MAVSSDNTDKIGRKYLQVLTRLYTRSILGGHPLESLLKAGEQLVKTR